MFKVYLEAAVYQRLHTPIKKINYRVDFDNVIIEKGTELYHGTGESFDVRNVVPGGYDNILWTTDSTYIARSYIPYNSSVLYASIDSLIKTLLYKKNRNPQTYNILTEQLGITSSVINKAYDFENDLFKQMKAIESRKKEIGERWLDFSREYSRRIKLADEDDNYDLKNIDEILNQIELLKREDRDLESQLLKLRNKKQAREYLGDIIKMKLNAYGYAILDETKSIKLMIDKNGSLLKNHDNDSRQSGKIIVIIPKRNMRFYNYAREQGFEGDLTEVQYHSHDVFEKAQNEGYDGIIINDFAQIENYGNTGHIAYGFFKHALKDCDISSIQGQKHPGEDEKYW